MQQAVRTGPPGRPLAPHSSMRSLGPVPRSPLSPGGTNSRHQHRAKDARRAGGQARPSEQSALRRRASRPPPITVPRTPAPEGTARDAVRLDCRWPQPPEEARDPRQFHSPPASEDQRTARPGPHPGPRKHRDLPLAAARYRNQRGACSLRGPHSRLKSRNVAHLEK
ncbi:hypothetical protein NDU88_005884 [Pleurodeles waltl]|uniref:Uncharacterized protein n=1 Tax=Pleurodeles waltl TaxID=8319 RepID=A0AAV7N5L6_PLEWA|nr:hypothetical protein NDU88_005884 [Pleurodeles waltl]